MQIWNVGSINRDHVYDVDRLAQPGETVASRRVRLFAGGKGYNQSVALARAGAQVNHVGRIGPDANDLLAELQSEGVDCRHVRCVEEASGHAIIQVAPTGENCILVHGGANRSISHAEIDAALSESHPGDVLLLQNETSAVDHAIKAGHSRGMFVVFNPAPMDPQVHAYPLEQVDLLILNQSEAAGFCNSSDPTTLCTQLRGICANAAVVLTLGADGALLSDGSGTHYQRAAASRVVDTTAAGDTFIGFFLASWIKQANPQEALRQGCHAAAICVAKPGAAASIPHQWELMQTDELKQAD